MPRAICSSFPFVSVGRWVSTLPSLLGLVAVATLGTLGVGCKDSAKESAAKAGDDAKAVVAVVDEDVGEVESGLPQGATKLAEVFAPENADQKRDPAYLRRELVNARRQVMDLTKAKSTFFAIADEQGVAMRNDAESDSMAGSNLVTVFPELSKALAGQFVETVGGFAVTKQNHDLTWVAGTPIKSGDGKVVGMYVTGWSLQLFAHHLQEARKHDFTEAAKAGGANAESKIPIEYVAVFHGDDLYADKQFPEVNLKALANLHLAQATANGPASGTLNLTDRDFGWAAARAPKLGANIGVVVLRSEI